MVTQAQQRMTRNDGEGPPTRLDSLHDGIGRRPIRPPAEPRELTSGSPWALAPWPTLEISKAVQDLMDRYLPGRGNRELIAAAGRRPEARLEAVMQECVLPGLRDVRDVLLEEGYDAELTQEGLRVTLRTRGFNGRNVAYEVEGGVYREAVFSLAGTQPGHDVPRFARLHIARGGGRRKARLHHCSRVAIARDALHHLRNQMLY